MVMPLPAPTAPAVVPGTADLQFVYSQDLTTGILTVDFALTPARELAFITGADRLVQDVLVWLMTPQGSDQLDPTFGNPLYGLIGRPGMDDPVAALTAMVTQAEATFLARQQDEVTQGLRTTDEQVLAFTNLSVTQLTGAQGVPAPPPGSGLPYPPGAYQITFTIVTQAGGALPATLLLPSFSQGGSAPLIVPPTPPPGGVWDSGVWDSGVWG